MFGLALSYLVYLVHDISTSFTIRGKNKEIKKEKDEVLELTKNVHQLELENEKQKNIIKILKCNFLRIRVKDVIQNQELNKEKIINYIK